MVLSLVYPQLALTAGIAAVLGLGMRRVLPWQAVRWLGALALLAAAVLSACSASGASLPLLRVDLLGRALTALFCLAALPVVLGPERDEVPVVLALGSVLGMTLIASGANLLMLFIGLELMSVPAYLLAARGRRRAAALEAGVKYFFAGGLAGALFLLGMVLHYAAAGSLALSPAEGPLPRAGLSLMAAAALFKIGAVPLHFWLPDVYEAADPEVAAFFSTGVKAAGVLFLMRLLELGPVPALPWVGAATAVFGAVMGLRQRSLQRLLAYSSISHAGLLILGAGTGSTSPVPVVFYLAVYLAMSAGAFLWVGATGLSERGELRGYAAVQPASAAVLALLLLSLAGIPPLGGFAAKFLILWEAVKAGLYGPALLAGLSSLVALGYYLGLIRDMYFEDYSGTTSTRSVEATNSVVAVCAALSAALGGAIWLWR